MNHRNSGWLIGLLALAVSLGMEGCSSTLPRAAADFRTGYTMTGDRTLQYRIPHGWLDASADSQAVGHLVWLVRHDYRASISVDRVHLNDDARAALAGNGLLELAGLQIGLASSSTPVEVMEQPVLKELNGKKACAYSLRMTPAGDIKRTVLVGTGSRLYAVHAYVAPQNGGDDNGRLRAIQEGFVMLLR